MRVMLVMLNVSNNAVQNGNLKSLLLLLLLVIIIILLLRPPTKRK